jgi:hypothetical protein
METIDMIGALATLIGMIAGVVQGMNLYRKFSIVQTPKINREARKVREENL